MELGGLVKYKIKNYIGYWLSINPYSMEGKGCHPIQQILSSPIIAISGGPFIFSKILITLILCLSFLLTPIPALTYTFEPNSYKINVPELPQETLNDLAKGIEGLTQKEYFPDKVECKLTNASFGKENITVKINNINMKWHNLDIKISFNFDGWNDRRNFSFNGVYENLVILWVKNTIDGQCRFDIEVEWSDIHKLSANLKGCPGELDQLGLKKLEEVICKTFDDALVDSLKLLDLDNIPNEDKIKKECSRINKVEPVTRKGNVVVNLGDKKTIYVRVTNTGESDWLPGKKIGLGLVYDNKSPCFLLVKPGRWYVTKPVAPGGTYTFPIQVTGAASPAQCECKLQMIRDLQAQGQAPKWFGPKVTFNIRVLRPLIKEK